MSSSDECPYPLCHPLTSGARSGDPAIIKLLCLWIPDQVGNDGREREVGNDGREREVGNDGREREVCLRQSGMVLLYDTCISFMSSSEECPYPLCHPLTSGARSGDPAIIRFLCLWIPDQVGNDGVWERGRE